ncbi:uncharacterized protein EV422DRAFT_223 [Fimicolochytrium jonesii]|uniref:uncharacterized protein n=1 Tax=Fimicolochytrium jonesii TaxID=1396493 RepID=UPI0022FE72EE|nr:uncharacterized protein EV422DRAFT_223 [Fimicolochytrium jonesii]KAI8826535.1 hypothetical protein EV422DRAFT_223 [Fimicolochytrium jonesii]
MACWSHPVDISYLLVKTIVLPPIQGLDDTGDLPHPQYGSRLVDLMAGSALNRFLDALDIHPGIRSYYTLHRVSVHDFGAGYELIHDGNGVEQQDPLHVINCSVWESIHGGWHVHNQRALRWFDTCWDASNRPPSSDVLLWESDDTDPALLATAAEAQQWRDHNPRSNALHRFLDRRRAALCQNLAKQGFTELLYVQAGRLLLCDELLRNYGFHRSRGPIFDYVLARHPTDETRPLMGWVILRSPVDYD